jgi:hypothetical protein
VWTPSGQPVQIVALVDEDDRVVGFGFPGFRSTRSSLPAPPDSRWIAQSFSVKPYAMIRACGVVKEGRQACRLDGEARAYPTDQTLASGHFIEPVPIVAGENLGSASLR